MTPASWAAGGRSSPRWPAPPPTTSPTPPSRRFSATDGNGTVIWHGPTRRRPTTEHGAYVRARDRHCRFPTCRRSARRAQIDHSTDHQHGGPTIPPNLGCLCPKHHRLKTLGHWQLMQLTNGQFAWRSKLGRTYLVQPEPIDDP